VIRTKEELSEVLYDKNANGPDPVYKVTGDVPNKNWVNVTIIEPGDFNGEFPKTYGHYNPENSPREKYKVVEGKGVLLLQKRDLSKVFLIEANPKDELIIPNSYGHSWSNVGDSRFVTYDNWSLEHTPEDYKLIKELHGMAYYVLKDGENIKTIPNPNYKNLPPIKKLTPEEFSKLRK